MDEQSTETAKDDEMIKTSNPWAAFQCISDGLTYGAATGIVSGFLGG